ncbi:bacteriophage holin [Halobacteria archaeon AArc-dxtr1]|nr:bacteriophage holin [Halobacteria archaeon AArc-dxtr1]
MAGKVDTRALALTTGIIWGTLVAFLELLAGTEYGERWRVLLEDIYPGYSREPGDLIWGTVLGFIDAFVLGYIFGRVYNRLAD